MSEKTKINEKEPGLADFLKKLGNFWKYLGCFLTQHLVTLKASEFHRRIITQWVPELRSALAQGLNRSQACIRDQVCAPSHRLEAAQPPLEAGQPRLEAGQPGYRR